MSKSTREVVKDAIWTRLWQDPWAEGSIEARTPCPRGLGGERFLVGEACLCTGYKVRSSAQITSVCENCGYYFPM
ncbi:MAG: hypothetical protein AABX17_03060 [Nanoarchaeota archaeon]